MYFPKRRKKKKCPKPHSLSLCLHILSDSSWSNPLKDCSNLTTWIREGFLWDTWIMKKKSIWFLVISQTFAQKYNLGYRFHIEACISVVVYLCSFLFLGNYFFNISIVFQPLRLKINNNITTKLGIGNEVLIVLFWFVFCKWAHSSWT